MNIMRRILAVTGLFLGAALGCFGQTPAYQIEKVPYASYLAPGKLSVVASFDGSKALDRWKDILAFAKEKSVKFTFFISSVYFIPDPDRQLYIYPIDPRKTGISDIGFGGQKEAVAQRIAFVQQAVNEGHDIESHLNGHFDGTRWTEAMWKVEFAQFNEFCSFLLKKPTHVRFPLLGMNSQVFPVLMQNGIHSITSVYGKDFHLFSRISLTGETVPYTIVEFPISFEHENGATILLMDYNFYMYDQKYHISMQNAEAEMVKLYLDEAQKCYVEKRPFFISHHFSNWNHAAYWNAMKQVIEIIGKKYSVEYLTISDLYKLVTS